MANNNDKKVLNVPALRFPEFTGEWENITIREACSEFQSGKNIKAEMINDQGLYPVYGGNAVCEQVKLVNKYDLPATFLLQYDALINPLYQDLLKSKLNDHSEIGAWWELTQPQIEAAGIKWRGEHSWVSHANIAFSTGYTKEERERLVDVYMAIGSAVFFKT